MHSLFFSEDLSLLGNIMKAMKDEEFEQFRKEIIDNIKLKYKVTDTDLKKIEKVLTNVKKPVMHIDELRCFHSHLAELFLSGGKLVEGSAFNPELKDLDYHVWIEKKDGKILDLFGWKHHYKWKDIPYEKITYRYEIENEIRDLLYRLFQCTKK